MLALAGPVPLFSLLATAAAKWFTMNQRDPRYLAYTVVLAVVALGLAPTLWMALIFAGVTWFCTTYGNVVWFPLMQEEVPPDMLGRASAVDWALSLALAPLGTVIAGALVPQIGVRLMLIIGGVITTAAGTVLLVPGVTDPDLGASRPLNAT